MENIILTFLFIIFETISIFIKKSLYIFVLALINSDLNNLRKVK